MPKKKKPAHENRWHIQDYPDNILKAGYMEWKYFNFLTPRYSGIIVYAVADPLDFTGRGGGRMLVRIVTPKGAVGDAEVIPPQKVKPSSYAADITMGENTIEVHEGNLYEIKGKTKSLEWNLRFSPETHGIKSFAEMGLVPLDLERASWLIEMPKARVRGTIKINGETIDIDGSGYCDSNWGAPIPLLVSFNWGQYSDESTNIIFMEIQNLQIGRKKIGRWGEVYVMHEDELIRFKKEEFTLEHLKWEKLEGTKIEMPTISLIKGENKHYRLSLLCNTEFSDPLYFKLPLNVPVQPVIVEQIASFHGTFHKKESDGEKLIHEIEGRGFKEYTQRDISLNNKTPRRGILVI
jgi:hypothetical protein